MLYQTVITRAFRVILLCNQKAALCFLPLLTFCVCFAVRHAGVTVPAPGGQAASGEDEPTVTISAQQMFSAVYGLFGGRLGDGPMAAPADAAPAAPSQSPTAAAADPTVTISTKDAFNMMNSMFGGGGGGGSDRSAQPPAPEPTISTSNAFGMINQLFAADLPHARGAAAPPAGASDPTISTRDAFACMNGLFSSQPADPTSSQPAAAAAEPTVTISTREAFRALNRLFSSQLAAPPAASSAAGHQQAHLPDATMTISTREAFDLVNAVLSHPSEPEAGVKRPAQMPLVKPNRKASS